MSARLLVAALLAVAALTAFGPAAHAEEVYARPDSGSWTLQGHGYGHGHGMSAWGAYGAAYQGVAYREILSTYYPGTAVTPVANETVRVRLTADPGSLRVSPTDGLSVVQSSGARTVLPGGVDQWRLAPNGAGLQLQSLQNGAWTTVPLSGSTGLASPARFEATSGSIRVWRADGTSTGYPGAVTALTAGATAVTSVLSLPIETYVRGVLTQEVVPSWPAEALRAFAVAIRTFAISYVRRGGTQYDICDTTSCQVYVGTTSYSASGTATSLEYPGNAAATTATAGQILTYQGAIATTQFSASNGGWSTDGGVPYLPARADPWDGTAPSDPVHSWTATLPVAALEAAFPAVGTLQRLVVTGRDGHGEWGGRVTGVRLEGTGGTVTTTGAAIVAARPYTGGSAGGLLSTWFSFGDRPPTGTLEAVSSPVGGAVRVVGWALDPDSTGPTTVSVTVDGASAGTAVADASRPDVGSANPGAGDRHGFDATLGAPAGTHTVCVDVLNIGSGGPTPVRLGCRSLVIGNPIPPVTYPSDGPPLRSPGGGFWLAVQSDGNLVVYSASGQVRWTTATSVPGSFLAVQSDGNLVLYDPWSAPVWTAGVNSPGGAHLVMQDDGNLVLYSASGVARWDSGGYARQTAVYFPAKRVVTLLPSGASTLSPAGTQRLTMQPGGAAVVTAVSGGAVRWSSGSAVPGSYLAAQTDGNVVIYSAANRPVWTAAVDSPGARLVFQDDGNLVVYDRSGRAVWDALGYAGRPGVLLG